jgi:RNA recognition motif-containing protein
MANKLYVGNIDYAMTDSDLQQLLESHGTVTSAQVIRDRNSGRSKGFGFVEMSSDHEAQAAIAALNGQESRGRTLTVSEARPKEENRQSYGGGRTARAGGGGRRYY